MQLDLFTPLNDGTKTSKQLADALGAKTWKLEPLLYALVAADLLTVTDDRFANTLETDRFLVRGRPDYIGGRHEVFAWRWNSVLKTAETIRSGLPEARFEFSSMSPEELESFYRGIHPETVEAGRDLLAGYDFSCRRNLLDVGGGVGGLAITVAQRWSHIHSTVVELPRVVPITQRYIEEAGVEDLVQAMAADVINTSMTGSYDVVIIKSFIQLLSPEEAQIALRNVGGVVEPGGVMYILGSILDNSRLAPAGLVGENLLFLNIYDEGQAYTEGEYKGWLTEAGFGDFERIVRPNGNSILVAHKLR